MSVDVDRDDDYDSMEASVFHAVKRPPAVLKHALLDKYLSPFVGKVGSTSIAGRVAFVDGFAGPGRYADLQEGSGALALRKANELAHIGGGRALECHFVEQDPATAARLASVVTEEARGATATVRTCRDLRGPVRALRARRGSRACRLVGDGHPKEWREPLRVARRACRQRVSTLRHFWRDKRCWRRRGGSCGTGRSLSGEDGRREQKKFGWEQSPDLYRLGTGEDGAVPP